MSDTIRAALEAAARGICLSISKSEACRAPCLLCREGAVAAVAAFLRAAPDLWAYPGGLRRVNHSLADAIEEAAKEAGDG